MQNPYNTPSSSPSSIASHTRILTLPSGNTMKETKRIVYFTEMKFLSSDDTPPTPTTPDSDIVHIATPSPSVQKRARLDNGQTTLTQVFNEEVKPPAPPSFLSNEDLKGLLREYRNKCQDLIDELREVYYWFDEATFKQEKFFSKALDVAMEGMDTAVGTLSIMGLPDMRRYFPGHDEDVYVLVKALSVHKCFSILSDIDVFSNEVKIHTTHVTQMSVSKMAKMYRNAPAYNTYGDGEYIHTRIFDNFDD